MAYETNDKMVSHPPHYQSKTGLEVIDVIRAFTSDLTGIEATDTGNVIKYICRWKSKNGLQDLEKARWYLDHLIEEIKGEIDDKNASTENTDVACRANIKLDNGVLFHDIDSAITAYTTMYEFLKHEEQLLVADVLDICGLSDCVDTFDYVRGWTRIKDFTLKPVDNGCILVFPPIQFNHSRLNIK